MISRRKFHPGLMKMSGRDDFQRGNASLKARTANLRCMRVRNIILEKAKLKFRIHRPDTQQNRGPATTAKSRNRSKKQQPQQKSSKNQPQQQSSNNKTQQHQKAAAMSCKHNMAAAYSFCLTFTAESNAILISPLQPVHHNPPCRC